LKTFIFQSAKYRLRPFLSAVENQNSTGEESGEASSETIGRLTDATNLQTHSFFSPRKFGKENFNHPRLAPNLTAEEKELLRAFLKELKLDFNEFNLKLRELDMSVKTFMLSLKENLASLRIPSPKISSAFIPELLNRGLLPETFLEKLEHKEMLMMRAKMNKRKDSFSPSPFSFRPR
jgi:hypothetical protein